jgi:hypothetical protein
MLAGKAVCGPGGETAGWAVLAVEVEVEVDYEIDDCREGQGDEDPEVVQG